MIVTDGTRSLEAFQWHGAGDCPGLVRHAPIAGLRERHVVQLMDGEHVMRRGSWLVMVRPRQPKVMSNSEFHSQYRLVESESHGVGA